MSKEKSNETKSVSHVAAPTTGSGQSIVCPFKVGDRVRDKFTGREATVTAVKPSGFDWKLDEPVTLITREGSWYDSGTCFPIGYEHYELVQNDQAHPQPGEREND